MRTRVMAFVAALLLVALGVALGAGPLQGDSDRAEREAAEQRDAITQRDARIADLHRQAEFGAAYTGATAARAVSGRLTDRKVGLVTLPGTDATTVELVEGLLRAAGAQVTGRIVLADALLDPSNDGLVEALSSQMVQQTPGLPVTSGANGYQRIGALVARAVGVPPSAHVASASYDTTAVSIVSSLKVAKLVESASVTARAGLTVVVLPPSTDAAQVSALTSVLAGYAAQIPSVVAGPATTAEEKQVLAVLRSQGLALSTVDSVDSSTGRVVAVLALAARTRGVTGDFGVVGAVNAAVPPDS